LDYERGTCIKEGCCEKSVCLPDETYRGAIEYRGEIRGDCDSPPGAFGVDSHALRPCEPGWDLDRERG
ncbi:MAG: hypothetical protein GTO08_04840, partial [Deltaproteobacteria bacterium]|nr:hypothetical protein [Deltaproteobacteria bacterium]